MASDGFFIHSVCVGQGDTTFLEYRNKGQTSLVLIDGFTGSSSFRPKSLADYSPSPSNDDNPEGDNDDLVPENGTENINVAWEYYQKHFRDVPVNLIVVTHWHNDHFNAIPRFIQAFSNEEQYVYFVGICP